MRAGSNAGQDSLSKTPSSSSVVGRLRVGSFDGGSPGGATASGGDDDEYEELDRRAIEAAEWVNKEIRKLIEVIQRCVACLLSTGLGRMHSSAWFSSHPLFPNDRR